MEFVLASRNKKKIAEMNTLLEKFCGESVKVLSLDDIGYNGDIEEDGQSFEENSVIKACAPAKKGYIGIADDSGLCVDALGGAPGVYSARYSGEDATDAENNEKLLRELEKEDNRKARFKTVISLVIPKSLGLEIFHHMTDPKMEEYILKRFGIDAHVCSFFGECEGKILREYRGDGGFGYDPLFFVPEKGKTFSELSAEEKNEISHRGRAMRCFGNNINNLFEVSIL
ncbi:MAG: non-canonical purine NTP pyrophosphatase [Clostridia bacterium]|nr:non-canonical purine NTP pyrophosphatase [Clostridia bacterium]